MTANGFEVGFQSRIAGVQEANIAGKADEMIILGDLYYHGPRNPLPKDYSPMDVCNILNSLKEKLKVVRGNCDALVDETISDFNFHDHLLLNINNKRIYFKAVESPKKVS